MDAFKKYEEGQKRSYLVSKEEIGAEVLDIKPMSHHIGFTCHMTFPLVTLLSLFSKYKEEQLSSI